jgi:homoserine O-acetyltransferase
MAALLTYRSRDSFESRFGRKYGQPAKRGRGGALSPGGVNGRKRGSGAGSGTVTPRGEDNLRAHNDGHRARKDSTGSSKAGTPVLEKTREVLEQLHVPLPTVVDQQDQTQTQTQTQSEVAGGPGLTNLELSMPGGSRSRTPAQQEGKLGTGASRQVFSAQSYLRYQGDKVRRLAGLISARSSADQSQPPFDPQFTSRFDANCYIHITRKMDTHDISFPSCFDSDPSILSHQLPFPSSDASEEEQTSALAHALSLLPPALVMGIESDGLFTTREQREIAKSIRDSELVIIPSPDGHDGFLLEFEAINSHIQRWLQAKLPEVYEREPLIDTDALGEEGFGVKKESLFGEAEADITRW